MGENQANRENAALVCSPYNLIHGVLMRFPLIEVMLVRYDLHSFLSDHMAIALMLGDRANPIPRCALPALRSDVGVHQCPLALASVAEEVIVA